MTKVKVLAVLFGVMMLAACGKKDPAEDRGDPGGCDAIKDISMCTDYTGETGGRGKKLCSGAWVASGCPKANLVGSCARENGNLIERYYSNGAMPNTAAAAKSSCEGTSGKFQP